ncbi:MAG: DUF4328 domain-containing protein [Rhizomicrobium sp.]
MWLADGCESVAEEIKSGGRPLSADTTYRFRDPDGLTRWLRYSLAAFIVISLSSLVQAGALLWFLKSVQAGAFPSRSSMVSAAAVLDFWQIALARVLFVGLLLNAIIYFVWLYRAGGNVRALGAQGLEASPGWSVGWYFIPFANLFMPPRNMGELWRASRAPSAWREQTGSALIGWWWACWLIANFSSVVGLEILIIAGKSLGTLQAGTVFQMLEFALNIPASVLLLTIVSRISAAQIAAERIAEFGPDHLPTTAVRPDHVQP